jgi:hypothetical protein
MRVTPRDGKFQPPYLPALGSPKPAPPDCYGLLVALHTLFYAALTLMLGPVVSSRGAVIGIVLALIFGQQVVGNFVGPFALYLPHSLGAMAAAIGMGQALPSYAAVGTTAILSVLFVALALWRFGREEL